MSGAIGFYVWAIRRMHTFSDDETVAKMTPKFSYELDLGHPPIRHLNSNLGRAASVVAFRMLPAIAFLVAAYAVFRIVSDLLQGPKRYPHVGLYIGALVLGALALLVITANCIDVYSAATSQSHHDTP
jgi:hypothetical protein